MRERFCSTVIKANSPSFVICHCEHREIMKTTIWIWNKVHEKFPRCYCVKITIHAVSLCLLAASTALNVCTWCCVLKFHVEKKEKSKLNHKRMLCNAKSFSCFISYRFLGFLLFSHAVAFASNVRNGNNFILSVCLYVSPFFTRAFAAWCWLR